MVCFQWVSVAMLVVSGFNHSASDPNDRARTTAAPSSKTQPVLTTIAIRAHHIDKMVAFYSEAFGFKFRVVDTYGIKSKFGELGGLTLKLVPIRDQADFKGYPMHQPGFTVDDVESIVQIATKHGGRQEGALTRKNDVVVSGAVRDPDGNTIELYRHPNK